MLIFSSASSRRYFAFIIADQLARSDDDRVLSKPNILGTKAVILVTNGRRSVIRRHSPANYDARDKRVTAAESRLAERKRSSAEPGGGGGRR